MPLKASLMQVTMARFVVLFKPYNTYFHNTFHPHIFSQHLNDDTKTTLSNGYAQIDLDAI